MVTIPLTDEQFHHHMNALLEHATLYRISLDELMAYNPGEENRCKLVRGEGGDHVIMVMFPEYVDNVLSKSLLRHVEDIRQFHHTEDTALMMQKKRQGYVLITEPNIIKRMEVMQPCKIRSFKEDMFPDGEVKPCREVNKLPKKWWENKIQTEEKSLTFHHTV